MISVRALASGAGRALRPVLLLALVLLGTTLLLRLSPGYFADAAELDAQHAESARARVASVRLREGSVAAASLATAKSWLHGDLGRSRQYDLPVTALLRPRLLTTASLLLRGVVFGWMLALLFAIPAASLRGWKPLGVPFAMLLAVPTGAMATLALHAEFGGPTLVLTLLVAARDFRFLESALRDAWTAPHLLQARAAGVAPMQLLRMHILPAMMPQLRALAVMSVVTALSALVPVEVLFDLPGVAQLAWSAALNRDLPVMLAVTMLMAALVAAMGLLSAPAGRLQEVQ